jgi:hypothetical protein
MSTRRSSAFQLDRGELMFDLKQKTVILRIDSHPSRFMPTWMPTYQYVLKCVQLM